MAVVSKGNILITSTGAKVSLVNAFRSAAHADGRKVLVSDITPQVDSASHADGFVDLPRSNDPGYLEVLLESCIHHEIALLVPTRDAELPLLAGANLTKRAKERHHELTVHVAQPKSVAICSDKLAFARFCNANGFFVQPPLSFEQACERLPVFARPLSGAGGRGVRIVRTQDELDSIATNFSEYIVTTLLDIRRPGNPEGMPEFTIDLLRDLTGKRHVGAVVRERVEVVDGESRLTRVVKRPDIEDLALRIGHVLQLVGHNTVQVIDAKGCLLLVEINARFGGACALGFKAGLNSPERLLAMLEGNPDALTPPQIVYGISMERIKVNGCFIEDIFSDAVI